MNRKERQFSASDIVFANIVQGGREVVSMSFTGIKTLSDIVDYLRRMIDRNLGPVVMKVRNFTQGWVLEQRLLMRALPKPQGVQLSLF